MQDHIKNLSNLNQVSSALYMFKTKLGLLITKPFNYVEFNKFDRQWAEVDEIWKQDYVE